MTEVWDGGLPGGEAVVGPPSRSCTGLDLYRDLELLLPIYVAPHERRWLPARVTMISMNYRQREVVASVKFRDGWSTEVAFGYDEEVRLP